MPTVLDVLRTELIGDEAANQLQQWLDARTAVQTVKPAAESTEPHIPYLSNVVSGDPSREPAGFLGVILGMGLKKGKVIEYLDELPVSAGYEPLFVGAGWTRVAARGVAALAVQHGKRGANEAKRYRPVVDAIRFLGKQRRQRRAIVRCSKILRRTWQETSIIETIFDEAGQSTSEFMHVIEAACEGHDADRQRVTDIAAAISRRLSLPRGPKITAPSAAYEFLFRQGLKLSIKRQPYLGRKRIEAYVDLRTEATQREFGIARFNSRPAQRRLRAERSKKPFAD